MWTIVTSTSILILGGLNNARGSTNCWSYSASIAVREMFDGNVYLQDSGPRGCKESFITSFLPDVGLMWKPAAAFNATAGYQGTANYFHAEPDEDHMVNRFSLNGCADLPGTKVESANSIVLVDGSEDGPTWTKQGGAPATGGTAVRDRRDACVYRNSLRVTFAPGPWMVRPAATFYAHDWQTRQTTTPGYQNYVDRKEWTAGADAGYRVAPSLLAFGGFRYGEQKQDELLRYAEHYDNTFYRVLFGVDGTPTEWLKVCATIGPEFREYEASVARAFEDRSRVNLFVDAALTASPSTDDRITLSVKQFQQPGFSGRSAYDDLTCDFDWRHKLGSEWTVGLANRAYQTRFLRPIERNDWVFSPAAFVNRALSERLNIEGSITYEIGLTKSTDAEGREYERVLAAAGLRYTWN